MNTIKHQMKATIVASALALTFASGCGTEVGTAPAEVGVDQEAPAPPEPRFQSPDSIDRLPTAPRSAAATPCVYSADAAERLGRAPCVS